MGQKETYEKWAKQIRENMRHECDSCGASLKGNNSGLNVFYWVTPDDELQEMVTCRDCKHRAYQKIGASDSMITWSGQDITGSVSLFQVEPK